MSSATSVRRAMMVMWVGVSASGRGTTEEQIEELLGREVVVIPVVRVVGVVGRARVAAVARRSSVAVARRRLFAHAVVERIRT